MKIFIFCLWTEFYISCHRNLKQVPGGTHLKPRATLQHLLQDSYSVITCHRLELCWDHQHILKEAHGYTPPGGEVSSDAASKDPTGQKAIEAEAVY